MLWTLVRLAVPVIQLCGIDTHLDRHGTAACNIFAACYLLIHTIIALVCSCGKVRTSEALGPPCYVEDDAEVNRYHWVALRANHGSLLPIFPVPRTLEWGGGGEMLAKWQPNSELVLTWEEIVARVIRKWETVGRSRLEGRNRSQAYIWRTDKTDPGQASMMGG